MLNLTLTEEDFTHVFTNADGKPVLVKNDREDDDDDTPEYREEPLTGRDVIFALLAYELPLFEETAKQKFRYGIFAQRINPEDKNRVSELKLKPEDITFLKKKGPFRWNNWIYTQLCQLLGDELDESDTDEEEEE